MIVKERVMHLYPDKLDEKCRICIKFLFLYFIQTVTSVMNPCDIDLCKYLQGLQVPPPPNYLVIISYNFLQTFLDTRNYPKITNNDNAQILNP